MLHPLWVGHLSIYAFYECIYRWVLGSNMKGVFPLLARDRSRDDSPIGKVAFCVINQQVTKSSFLVKMLLVWSIVCPLGDKLIKMVLKRFCYCIYVTVLVIFCLRSRCVLGLMKV